MNNNQNTGQYEYPPTRITAGRVGSGPTGGTPITTCEEIGPDRNPTVYEASRKQLATVLAGIAALGLSVTWLATGGFTVLIGAIK